MKPTEQTIDPTGTKLLREFQHEIPLMSCVIDPTGRWCFAGGRGRKIYLTNINTGVTEARDDHESWVVTSARWGTSGVSVISLVPQLSPPPPPLPEPRAQDKPASPEGAVGTDGNQSMVLTGDLVGRLICWDTLGERPDVRWSIETGHGTLRTVAISNDGELVATGGGDGMLRLWSASDGSLVRELAGHACPVFSSAFHPDGKHLLTGDRGDQKIKQWDYNAGSELREFDAKDLSNYKGGTDINYGGVRDLAFTPDGAVIFCCGRDSYGRPGLLLQFDWETGKQIRKQVSTFANSIFHHVLFHPQGFFVTAGVGAQTGEIWFWKPDQEEKLASVKVTGPAYGMDLHPDGRHIAVAQMTGPRTYGDKGVVGLYQIPLSKT
jgi:WD40 repeat protein